ncbi:MAG: tetratricopeptide repeat protein, partial [Fibrobacteres bacterium]|nr:tetratricopeptide repeat protein [Fibrobacterota bacterium]
MQFIKFFLISAFSLLSISGCVYFNTYYNAEKYFSTAREQQIRRLASGSDTSVAVTENEKKLYTKSIEKCSKVLDVYAKDRKYVPLSILLLGEIYYWQAEYPAAIRKFNEFISNNQEHKLLFRAFYYKGLAYMQQGDYALAEKELERVAIEGKSRSLKNRARYMLAEIAMKRGSTFGALDELKKLEGGGRAMSSLIHFKTGMLFYKQKDFDNAFK